MRIPAPALVKLAFAAALALAAPAASQQADRAGLRGPRTDDRPAPAAEPPAAPLPPASPLPSGPILTPAQAADQCRANCARTYYFCLSSDTSDDCPTAWSRCRLACNGDLPAG